MKRCYDFTPDQVAAIERLADSLNINKTNVLMNGLALFRTVVAEARDGRAIGVIEGDRVVKQLVGVWTAARA